MSLMYFIWCLLFVNSIKTDKVYHKLFYKSHERSVCVQFMAMEGSDLPHTFDLYQYNLCYMEENKEKKLWDMSQVMRLTRSEESCSHNYYVHYECESNRKPMMKWFIDYGDSVQEIDKFEVLFSEGMTETFFNITSASGKFIIDVLSTSDPSKKTPDETFKKNMIDSLPKDENHQCLMLWETTRPYTETAISLAHFGEKAQDLLKTTEKIKIFRFINDEEVDFHEYATFSISCPSEILDKKIAFLLDEKDGIDKISIKFHLMGGDDVVKRVNYRVNKKYRLAEQEKNDEITFMDKITTFFQLSMGKHHYTSLYLYKSRERDTNYDCETEFGTEVVTKYFLDPLNSFHYRSYFPIVYRKEGIITWKPLSPFYAQDVTDGKYIICKKTEE